MHHVALFVDKSGDRTRSELFHVVKDEDQRTTDICLKYEQKGRFNLAGSRSAIIVEDGKGMLIGTMPAGNLQRLQSLCSRMDSPRRAYNTERPDCNTWLDNVIFDIDKKEIAQLSADIKIPSKKKPLVTSRTTKGAGSSSSRHTGQSS